MSVPGTLRRGALPALLGCVLAAVVSVSTAGGCFETPLPECAFLCGTGGLCPDGYRCAGDGVCKRDDVPEATDCGFAVTADSGAPDGMVDGAVADGTPPDSAMDAMMMDAMPVDASPDADAGDAGTDARTPGARTPARAGVSR